MKWTNTQNGTSQNLNRPIKNREEVELVTLKWHTKENSRPETFTGEFH